METSIYRILNASSGKDEVPQENLVIRSEDSARKFILRPGSSIDFEAREIFVAVHQSAKSVSLEGWYMRIA